MQLTFWGVRGSLPSPEPWAWRYGGNTPCVEIQTDDQLFILDAGTGIRDLGHDLIANRRQVGLVANILLTHYHWDHIQGLPFFEPLYYANSTLHFFGPPLPDSQTPGTLGGVLSLLFHAPFFPVTVDGLRATYTLREFDWWTDYHLGLTRVRTCRLNHPQGALGYRLDRGGVSIVYATDHEPGAMERDQELIDLARDADILISDAEFHPEELSGAKRGWGHGSWKESARLARAAGVRQLILFHHDQLRTDDEIDLILAEARREFPNTLAAAEGMYVDLSRGEMRVGSRRLRISQRSPAHVPVEVETMQGGRAVREQVQLENISFHGAYFLSATDYEPQQPISLTVRMPSNGVGRSAGQAAGAGGTGVTEVRLQGYVLRTEPATLDSGWKGVAVLFPGRSAEPPVESFPKPVVKVG